MQKRKDDVKARTTLLLSLPDEHQLRFSKYKTTQELWAAILKTFGDNEATKKTKKNLLKQQYGNFKAEGSETLEQMFNRLHVIISQLEFIEIEIEQDDLNQKRNHSQIPRTWLLSLQQNTAVEVKKLTLLALMFPLPDINQIDEDDIEEIDIKWNMALLSKRADREYRAPRSQDRGRRDNYRQWSKVEEQAPKALMAIDEVGWDWSYMANDDENHALVADEEAPSEFALMAKTSAESEDLEFLKKEKGELETKLTGFQTASKDIVSLLESQRLDKNKEGLGYSTLPPPPAQVYSPPKKDMSWTGLPEFKDD
nr:hypothetical protein [Tanacetum cinerariifolium]